jgi:molecular chaperone DnaK (HSP70)
MRLPPSGPYLRWPASSTSPVLAIDYGTDFITASLMKPGILFDVLLNTDSKRMITSTVGWKKGDRLLAQDAFNTVRRVSVLILIFVMQGGPNRSSDNAP